LGKTQYNQFNFINILSRNWKWGIGMEEVHWGPKLLCFNN